MPTIKQQLALKKTMENGGNITKAMREVGYSEATINSPSNLSKSAGFLALLKASGLDEELVTTALVEDIRMKPQNRARELTLASELLGMKYKGQEIEEDKNITVNLVNYSNLQKE